MKRHEAQLSRRCHRVFVAQDRQPPAREESGRADRRPDEDYTRRAERRPRSGERYDDGFDAPRDPYGGDDAPRRVERLPVAPDDDFDAPRRPVAPYDEEDVPRRAERPVPPDADADGYGPRRYLYLSPRGRAEAPEDAY